MKNRYKKIVSNIFLEAEDIKQNLWLYHIRHTKITASIAFILGLIFGWLIL